MHHYKLEQQKSKENAWNQDITIESRNHLRNQEITSEISSQKEIIQKSIGNLEIIPEIRKSIPEIRWFQNLVQNMGPLVDLIQVFHPTNCWTYANFVPALNYSQNKIFYNPEP